MSAELDKPLFGFMTRSYPRLVRTSSLWGTETIISLILALGSASYVMLAIIAAT